jgi:class 3 adenylate cyclase
VQAALDGGAAVEPAGELVLKGFHRPVPAFRVVVDAA